ncbi:MAG: sialic acid synthase [Candidatus Saganbacteria bacterium]|uniref:Sialic acid synthase n=1 Tax=Candidatus Saganbacteria bacterium TaxID=2575572 RepID=A0A833L2G1_UNCSA|nr:MAG: sialic acid synthase [Candidatus Saganbacteria bacterium]
MRNIKLIIYDFDGVMTDNRVLIGENGEESVFVDRSDGLAISELKKLGIKQIIVSTETNPVVGARAKKLNIPFLQSQKDKKTVVKKYLQQNKIDKNRVVYIGNDINDKEVMLEVGWPIAPFNAHEEIKKISKIVLKTKGGYGVIREFLDKLGCIENG